MRHRIRLESLWRRVAVVALCLVASGCDGDIDEDCETACDLLVTCGMLPSALGTGNGDSGEDCKQRCALTSESVRRPIQACLEGYRVASGERPWCSGGHGCREISACLAQQTDDPVKVLGRTRLNVRLQAVAATNAAEQPPSSDECKYTTTIDTLDPTTLESDPQTLCTLMGASEVEFVLQSETPEIARGRTQVVPCAYAFSRGVEHVDLPPGLYANYVHVRGSEPVVPDPQASTQEPGTDAGAPTPRVSDPYCRTVHGERRLLRANKATVAILGLPMLPAGFESSGWFPCEDTEGTCSDGIDNDRNDLADCAELHCAPFCQRKLCTAGEADASICVPDRVP